MIIHWVVIKIVDGIVILKMHNYGIKLNKIQKGQENKKDSSIT